MSAPTLLVALGELFYETIIEAALEERWSTLAELQELIQENLTNQDLTLVELELNYTDITKFVDDCSLYDYNSLQYDDHFPILVGSCLFRNEERFLGFFIKSYKSSVYQQMISHYASGDKIIEPIIE